MPIKAIDRFNDWLGLTAAWMFAATGVMLTYEVLARYLFNAPTTWAAELSQLLLIWGTFLGAARALQRREHIRITVLEPFMPAWLKRGLEVFSILFIGTFAAVVLWYGNEIAWDSLVRGRSTGTMLNLPNWWSEAVIPIAMLLLGLQCGAELIKTLGAAPEDSS